MGYFSGGAEIKLREGLLIKPITGLIRPSYNLPMPLPIGLGFLMLFMALPRASFLVLPMALPRAIGFDHGLISLVRVP